MGVIVDTKKLYHILKVTPATQNIMLVGKHGIGKSEVLSKYYESQGYTLVTLFLGQMSDPGDLIGLPRTVSSSKFQVPNPIDERTDFVPPFWFPTDERPIVLFLDELNRARPEILQTIMDLTLNRKLAGKSLPKGSRIIAAVNEGDEYLLTQLDPALVSRFNVYYFCPTVQEWLLWAEQNGIDKRITNFIANDATWLDGAEGQKVGIDTGLDKYPDRRAWERVSDIIKDMPEISDDDLDVIAGIVGAPAASRFFGSVTGNRTLSGAEVLADFEKHRETLKKYLLHQLAMVNESIFRHLEFAADAKYAANLEAYYDLLVEMKEKEAIAHLCNVFESGNYQKAILFITQYTPGLYMKMMQFIAEL